MIENPRYWASNDLSAINPDLIMGGISIIIKDTHNNDNVIALFSNAEKAVEVQNKLNQLELIKERLGF